MCDDPCVRGDFRLAALLNVLATPVLDSILSNTETSQKLKLSIEFLFDIYKYLYILPLFFITVHFPVISKYCNY